MSEKTFYTHGEWEDEPDFEEFVHAELPCIVVRTDMGHLCGYVGVPPNHPAYPERMKDIREFTRKGIQKEDGDWLVIPTPNIPPNWTDVSYQDLDIDVHGGLTWSEIGDDYHGRKEGFKWFGFDCAHAWDYLPPTNEKVHQIYVEVTGRIGPSDHETYRNWEYVKQQTEHLAEQLAVMMQPPSYEEWKEKISK